ncbi:hypothetical protein NC651_001540 [Populus alba x Populus x berolinensis]|nr:hypothetical protein NC651_001540 [Populus alba x Populus x berolinensis]
MLTWKIKVTRPDLSPLGGRQLEKPTSIYVSLPQLCRIWEMAMLVELAKEYSKPRPGPSEA